MPTRGLILRVPLAGGTPENLAGNTIGPFGIAVDDTNVYWVEQFTATSLNGGRVLTIPKAGATPTVVAADQLEPFRVRLDASYVYWAAHGDYVENYIDGGIYRVAKGGGAVQPLAAESRSRATCGGRLPRVLGHGPFDRAARSARRRDA